MPELTLFSIGLTSEFGPVKVADTSNSFAPCVWSSDIEVASVTPAVDRKIDSNSPVSNVSVLPNVNDTVLLKVKKGARLGDVSVSNIKVESKLSGRELSSRT